MKLGSMFTDPINRRVPVSSFWINLIRVTEPINEIEAGRFLKNVLLNLLTKSPSHDKTEARFLLVRKLILPTKDNAPDNTGDATTLETMAFPTNERAEVNNRDDFFLRTLVSNRPLAMRFLGNLAKNPEKDKTADRTIRAIIFIVAKLPWNDNEPESEYGYPNPRNNLRSDSVFK
jgi:hypothetical protein